MDQYLGVFQPGRPCPACSAEGGQPEYHERPVMVSFGRSPSWACARMAGRITAHMCTKCPSCGFTWTEDMAPGASQAPP